MFLAIMQCSSGQDMEDHVNLSIVSVVDIPRGSDGYSSLETAVLPISYIGESVLQLFKTRFQMLNSVNFRQQLHY
jgi:hypothetical protein